MNKIKIAIVGGGTAGWMAASFFSKYYDGKNITLIESPSIPKIGVGESVTPHVNSFFEEIGVDRHHWMKNTSAVYKLANKFIGWKEGKDESEFFSFNYTTQANNFYKDITQVKSIEDFSKDTTNDRTTDYILDLIKSQKIKKFDQYFNPQHHYMIQNVSPFNNKDCFLNSPFSYTHHINAELAWLYLRDNVALPRGVNHIISNVETINHNDDHINYLVLSSGEQITADLFIDCTGFHKSIIKHLNWPSKEYKNHSIDRAWVCQSIYSDQKTEMVNYSQTIAEPYGWRFKIGLYHRMGNGYCFSSQHYNESKALEHLNKKLKNQKTTPKLVKWSPERLDKFAGGNVAAIGLSCGFIEPLEANALYVVVNSIRRLFKIIKENEQDKKFNFTVYNEKMKYTIDDIADFILLHYTLSSRSDTDFWKDMQSIGKKEDHESLLWEKYNNEKNSMHGAVNGFTMFPDYMWAQLAASWGLLNKFDKKLDKTTLMLAENYFRYSENKHEIIASTLENNYIWHKKHIFDNLEAKEWEKIYYGPK